MEKSFEIVPDNISRRDLIDEAHRRSARAGYCSRSGEPLNKTRIMTFVPQNKKQYDENYERIFGHS